MFTVIQAWNQLGIDFIGPLTTTPRRNKYILTIVDYFTKWAEADPMKTKEADGVVSVLFEVIQDNYLYS